MKNIIIVFISIVILSCDPNYITTYYLRNNTNDSIIVEFFRNGLVDYENNIPANSSIVLLQDASLSGAPTKISFESDDSIRVTKRDRFIMFYRDSTSKSEIYNMENWVEKKVGKHNYKYTYTFNEEDFN